VADEVLNRISNRPAARLLYLPAPTPPAFIDRAAQDELAGLLVARAARAGARLLSTEDFSLGTYFASGLPVAARSMGRVATLVVEQAAVGGSPVPAKVLVTDLDNTLWRGVISEDGPDGIAWQADGAGYRHFVYQTFLRLLKDEGALLAAVSRNSPDVALAPFASGQMPLRADDFVTIVASYYGKSGQIRELARQLNLNEDAFVFVDDNPVELEEVARQLPAVACMPFPNHDDELPAFLTELNSRFTRREITEEDKTRTELYRRRLEGMVPQESEAGDVRDFLRQLRMRLVLHDRTSGDRSRAIQLVNKTNQFNLNGHRISDPDVAAVLAAGGRLLTATLEDRTGSHGEILAMLITADRRVMSFVLSCRVFQRRVEQAFCAWLAGQPSAPTTFSFVPTDRNEPFQMFLRDPAFETVNGGDVSWDTSAYTRSNAAELSLFEVVAPEPS
jgi:FkbH-like protein